MKHNLLRIVFLYSALALTIYILDMISPGAHDGGLGLGGLALLLVPLLLLIITCVNIYKGFKINKSYFLIALIHIVTVVVIFNTFFN